jgi:hypothetical protein
VFLRGSATVSIALHSMFVVLETLAPAWKASWWPTTAHRAESGGRR